MTTDPQTDLTARLHNTILGLEAELAKMRDLLRSENQRANAAVDREETAEEAALEAQQERDRLLAAAPVSSPPPDQTALRDRGAKAEALLLHFTAEAHRRKWNYDRGLDDDGQPVRSEAFDALHRLGDEMNVELHKLRAAPAAPPPADRAAVLLWAADQIDAETRQLKADEVLEPDKFRPCRDASAQLRRLAAEAQQEGTAHSCSNCDGIDPDSCLMNSNRPGAEAPQPDTEARCSCGGWFLIHHLHADDHQPAVPVQPAADDSGEEAGA